MYHYESCGLPNVYLKNGFEIDETDYGKTVAIANLEGLHRALAKNILVKAGIMSAAEFRFLRKELDLSQAVLAEIMGVSEPTIRNWEAGRGEQGISKLADAALRHLYVESLNCDSVVAKSIKEISALHRELHEIEMALSLKDNTWTSESLPQCA